MAYRDERTIEMQIMGLANATSRLHVMSRPHRHNEVELNFVEAGSMTYLFSGARAEVKAGQLALFWAAIPHQTVHVAKEGVFHWLTIPFASFLQWRLPDPLVQQVICGQFVQGDVVGQSVQTMFRQWHSDLQASSVEHHRIVLLEVEACLRRLALSIYDANASLGVLQNAAMPPHALGKVEQMACFIAEHYTEPLHSDDIAAVVHLHPNYAMSLFRKHFGVTMMEYITQYRVAHAQRLLITSEANISAIALEAGFGSVSRFYTVFKAACGQQPGEYRNRLQLRE